MSGGVHRSLNTRNAEACRRIIETSGTSGELLSRFDGGTLAGCVEHFLLNSAHLSSGQTRREIRAEARAGVEPWAPMLTAWSGRHREVGNIFRPRRAEFMRVDAEHWSVQFDGWQLFEQRFHSALLRDGFDPEFAIGLMQVFHELSDNVIQHGGLGEVGARGIAAYHVEAGRFAFSIGDLGCGFLRSLQMSETWTSLESDRDALLAVIHKGASRRHGQGEGEGFKLLWKSLADHGTLVRIRSCSAVASVRPTSSGREAEVSMVPSADGSHVSVCCTMGKPTGEDDLRFSWTPSPE